MEAIVQACMQLPVFSGHHHTVVGAERDCLPPCSWCCNRLICIMRSNVSSCKCYVCAAGRLDGGLLRLTAHCYGVVASWNISLQPGRSHWPRTGLQVVGHCVACDFKQDCHTICEKARLCHAQCWRAQRAQSMWLPGYVPQVVQLPEHTAVLCCQSQCGRRWL